MSFSVSTAKVDITPTLSTNPYLAGYGAQSSARVATSSTPYAQLFARCLILWEDGKPHAIVTLDVLNIPRSVHLSVRPKILALASWWSADVILQATHTHNGPVLVDSLQPYLSYALSDLTLVRSYTAWLEQKIVDVVRTALNATKTAVTLDYHVTTSGIAFNRAGLPYVETAVPVLTARKSNGVPRAIIFSYGCHPIAAGMRTLYDGDFPAGACEYIESSISGCFPIYLQGTAGDQDPRGVWSWGLRDQYSEDLGRSAVDVASSAGRVLTGPLQTSYDEMSLPLDILNSTSNLAAVRSAFVTRMGNPQGQPAWYQRHAQVMVSRIDSNTLETEIINPSHVWKLQGSPMLRIALTGGEVVSGYGVYFRNRYNGSNGLVIGGYANEVSCYIPSNEFLPPYMPSGSYEGGWDPDFPGIGGGNLTVYGHLARFKAGSSGVEAAYINALNAQLL